jgi:hypothetical protein
VKLHTSMEELAAIRECAAWIARNIPRGMYESALGRVAIRFSRGFGNRLVGVQVTAGLIVMSNDEAREAVRGGAAALDAWEATQRELYTDFREDIDAASDIFLRSFGAIRFIEEAYNKAGAHAPAYGPVATVPLRAAVLAAFPDAAATAPRMPDEWADEVLVRASPDALQVLLARWLERCLRVHPELSLAFRADPDRVHLTLHAPDPREMFDAVQTIERPMLAALAHAAGALPPPEAPSPDTLVALTFARA